MPLRILIVEDQALIAAELEAALGEFGHQVVGTADDAKSAALSAAADPDLALVDVNLRDGPTGPAIAARLAGAGVSVIFTTANPEQIPAELAQAAGRLPKPWTLAQLRDALTVAAWRRDGPPEAVAA